MSGLTKEQLEARRAGVGSSDIGAIAGLSPYRGPFEIWQAKVEGAQVEETPPMKRGRILESAVALWYAEDTKASLRQGGTVRSHANPLLMATPDYYIGKDEKLLECKTAHFRSMDAWGEAGTDLIPPLYGAQVQWQMGVTGISSCDVAVLVSGDDFRIYPVAFDAETFGYLVTVAEKFWVDYVLTKKAPPPDGSEAYAEHLRKKFPRSDANVIRADKQLDGAVNAYRMISKTLKEAEKKRDQLRQEIESCVGNAEGAVSDTWKLSFKYAKGRESVDYKALCFELGVPKSTIEKHTTRTPYRTLRVTDKASSAVQGVNMDEAAYVE